MLNVNDLLEDLIYIEESSGYLSPIHR